MNDAETLGIKQRFGIIGNSPLLNHAIRVAMQVAPTDMTVLITGESGSGKESFSKIIHQLSTRKHGQFIAINCGAIPEGTIDSELFGHEKGSFTGAIDARKGYFEVTDGGTIFLDEIAEMPMSTQARLLRVLEVGEFIKVGSSKVKKSNVRVIAATNITLQEAVEKGKFRKDLYYRLNTVPIFVPALRQRGDDIDLLFRKFASDFSEKYRTKAIQLLPEAKELLLKFQFPGNIRQLKNLAEQISVLELNRTISGETMDKYLPKVESQYPVLLSNEPNEQGMSERDILYKVLFDLKKDVSDLKAHVRDIINNRGKVDTQPINNPSNLLKSHNEVNLPVSDQNEENTPYVLDVTQPTALSNISIDRVEDISHETEADESLSIERKEKELILKALRKNNNKRKYAAQDLGISERTLYRKIKQYDIQG